MTLLRQLTIVIVTLFLLLFIGTLLLSISNTRDYLNEQLRTITQDTATSLGLTLTPPMKEKDMAVVDRMISAVSDSGYYREVSVVDVEGKPLVSRSQKVKLGKVPQWFVDRVTLETPVDTLEFGQRLHDRRIGRPDLHPHRNRGERIQYVMSTG